MGLGRMETETRPIEMAGPIAGPLLLLVAVILLWIWLRRKTLWINLRNATRLEPDYKIDRSYGKPTVIQVRVCKIEKEDSMYQTRWKIEYQYMNSGRVATCYTGIDSYTSRWSPKWDSGIAHAGKRDSPLVKYLEKFDIVRAVNRSIRIQHPELNKNQFIVVFNQEAETSLPQTPVIR